MIITSPDLMPMDVQQCIEWQNKVVKVRSKTDPTKIYEVTADFSEHRLNDNNFECTCPAYQFQGMAKSGAECKHILAVKKKFCQWHSEYGDAVQSDDQEMNHVCPQCGGQTESVIWMV